VKTQRKVLEQRRKKIKKKKTISESK